MSFFQKSIAVLGLAALLVTSGCGGPTKAELEAAKPVKLTIWRVFDTSESFDATMAAYQALHKNVSFEYRTLRYDEYESELLHAFAEGKGPDIFSLNSNWIGEYESLALPLPKSLSIPYTETRGTIKKETIVTIKEEPTITQRQLKTDYIDAVADMVIRPYQPNPKLEAEDRIWGLPLSVDTLALFYNKDLLNAAGIAEPPKTWTTFQEDVAKLTTIGPNDTIVQSGAAIGSSTNVERAFDILSLLMMQNGTKMTDDNGNPKFASQLEDKSVPGADATRFYSDFANPLKSVYTWNADQPSSFEAFTSGKTAMFLGYSYHISLIKTQAPKLDFGIAVAPQISAGRTVNYANFWIETVSKATKSSNWAWDFIQFAAKAEQAKTYLDVTKKPTALRSLITEQLQDEDLSIFATQLLTAKSWYKGDDASVAETAILELIDGTIAGEELEVIIRNAQSKVDQTM